MAEGNSVRFPKGLAGTGRGGFLHTKRWATGARTVPRLCSLGARVAPSFKGPHFFRVWPFSKARPWPTEKRHRARRGRNGLAKEKEKRDRTHTQ